MNPRLWLFTIYGMLVLGECGVPTHPTANAHRIAHHIVHRISRGGRYHDYLCRRWHYRAE